jgi:hypothetical protein
MFEERGIGSFFADEATATKVVSLARKVGVNVVTEGGGDCVHVRIENIASPTLLREKHELLKKSLMKQFEVEEVKKKNWCGIVAAGIIVGYFLVYAGIILLW